MDSANQLEKVSRLQLYQYQFRDRATATENNAGNEDLGDGSKSVTQVGLLAQELREVLPDAVHESVSYEYKS